MLLLKADGRYLNALLKSFLRLPVVKWKVEAIAQKVSLYVVNHRLGGGGDGGEPSCHGRD